MVEGLDLDGLEGAFQPKLCYDSTIIVYTDQLQNLSSSILKLMFP